MKEQRWRDGRHTWAEKGRLDVKNYHVEQIEHAPGKAFVTAHHYKGSWPATRFVVGMFRTIPNAPFLSAQLVGVAAFGVPCNERVIPCYTGAGPREGVELSRFVLTDEEPHGSETVLSSRALKLLPTLDPALLSVVSYSDPLERVRADGVIIKPGHFGTAYQAGNALFMGRTGKRSIWIGRATGADVSEKAIGKLIHGKKGREYAARQIARETGSAMRVGESGAAYVARVKASGALYKIQHPGNFAYAWPLVAELRRDIAQIAGLALPFEEEEGPGAARRAWQRALSLNASRYPKQHTREEREGMLL